MDIKYNNNNNLCVYTNIYKKRIENFMQYYNRRQDKTQN